MTRIIIRLIPLLLMMTMTMLASASDPQEVYKFYCVQCHGFEGKGNGINVTPDFATDPRDFTNKVEMEKLSDADIRNVILEGGPAISKSELMPAWSTTLTSDEVDGLVAILRCYCQCDGALQTTAVTQEGD